MSLIEAIIASLAGDEVVKEVRIGPFWTGVWSRYCGLASTTFNHEHENRFPVGEAGFWGYGHACSGDTSGAIFISL